MRVDIWELFRPKTIKCPKQIEPSTIISGRITQRKYFNFHMRLLNLRADPLNYKICYAYELEAVKSP